jgi:hypothetical protein
MQHAVNTVLHPRHLLNDLRPLRHKAPERLSGRIRHPDLGQEAAGMQLRQHGRVDLVSFDLGMGDRAHLQRIGDHHPPHKRPQQTDDRCRVDGGFEHDLVVGSQLASECDHRVSCQVNPAAAAEMAVLQNRDHRHRAVHIQSDHSHAASFILGSRSGSQRATRHLRIRAHSATGLVAGAAR